MSMKEKIASLESKLMERGYYLSEILPGDVKPTLMKGGIGVKLTEPIADYKGQCVMEIYIPSMSENVERYWRLFGLCECGKKVWLKRNFPYANVTSNVFHTNYHEYLLPLSDQEVAVKAIEREVNFTRKMLEDAGILTKEIEGQSKL